MLFMPILSMIFLLFFRQLRALYGSGEFYNSRVIRVRVPIFDIVFCICRSVEKHQPAVFSYDFDSGISRLNILRILIAIC
jgi:hypothetical protein